MGAEKTIMYSALVKITWKTSRQCCSCCLSSPPLPVSKWLRLVKMTNQYSEILEFRTSDPSWILELFPWAWSNTQLLISLQLIFPEGAQPRELHTATALSLGPGWTQVTMFGGCPKWEREKSDNALQKLLCWTLVSRTHTTAFIHLLLVAYLYVVLLPVICLMRTNRTRNHFEGEAPINPSLITILLLCTGERTLGNNCTFHAFLHKCIH